MDASSDRGRLRDELLEELVVHTPAAAVRHMRRWPGGPVSMVHVQVLTILEADGPVPMRVLAEALDVSQASVTGIVDRMEQRGLVERRRDPDDRRVVRVAIAEQGRVALDGFQTQRRDHLREMLDELREDELAGFLTGIRALRRVRERRFPHLAEKGSP